MEDQVIAVKSILDPPSSFLLRVSIIGNVHEA
jgi:hypothetical protein